MKAITYPALDMNQNTSLNSLLLPKRNQSYLHYEISLKKK